MINKVKIYFLENSFNYNGSNLNSAEIGGSEKTLINISTELGCFQSAPIHICEGLNF